MNLYRRWGNSGSTAITAPHWMTMLNRSDFSTCKRRSATRRCPVEETGMNSVIPSTTPRMRLISQSGMNHLSGKPAHRARRKFSRCACEKPDPIRTLFFTPERFLIDGALLDLELAEDGVPADVDLVPLGLQAAQRAFAHLAEVAERRGVADEVVDLLARGVL